MCITAHFIGVDWKLHKKIINFCEIKSYRGSDIGEAIAICLEEWNLKNIFCITTDNATANDTAIVHLKKKFATWGDSIFGGKYLHMRCVAHILNLIVSDGLEEVDMSVRRVREAVRWVRSSPARILACKKCVVFKQMDPKSLLRLDVATRWNSTYLMLETAEKFEEPFLLLEQSDRAFKYDLIAKRHNNMVIGTPRAEDWSSIRHLMKYLKFFYDLTLVASGSSYVTSHLFLREMGKVFHQIGLMKETGDEATIKMAERMWEKFGKYWSEKDATNDRMNRLTYIAVVLYPRHKMEYPKYALQKLYGDARGLQLLQEVNTELQSLFEVYQTFYNARQQPIPTQSSTDSEILNMSEGAYTYDFESGYSMTEYVSSRTELELYLKADREPYDPKSKHMFDILGWWKTNSVKYPILSDIARDILAVPISTVPSESAFSTGGRVLDSFRSSLSLQIVEALICCGDWIRSSKPLQNDDEEDLTVLLDAQDELEDGMLFFLSTLYFLSFYL
ncbi:Putative AC transposase [Linum grandiflorum]